MATHLTIILAIACGCSKSDSASRLQFVLENRFDPPAVPLAFEGPIQATAKARIICLVPSSTEVLFALGFGGRIIGVDRWADFPPEAQDLPRLGDISRVATERILDLNPDLVILFECQGDAAELLRRAGIDVFIPETEGSMFGSIASVAKAAGAPERGEQLLARLNDEVRLIKEKNAGRKPVRTLMVFERVPRISVTTSVGFYQEMLDAARAINVSGDAHEAQAFTWASVEQVLDWQPQVIIDLTYDQDGTRRKEAEEFWRKLLQKDARVHLIDAPVLARPGPRIAQAITFLTELIHER
jgi:iron complex transport system substrate-binding protein